ncbi:uncharacterized protein SAPINGB_P006024 [Magnusiomyces paraingens]|uniref:Dienelactone hydrolase domain-containing protein n=1 Tax=Magnusiomyces paraingens TaxID=2606893 RepID=A0A5E8C2U5_9ASCO|nr:uncharacterized protein SAPINGB_P006024 [Saprochaete ingens]VVT58074.1 unnamed protein product [Saprochaete ingens]
MASNPPSNCCAQGFKHTGTSTGKFVQLDGINYYVTGDESFASSKLHILLTDILGNTFINNQLLADQFAQTGYFVVVPDLFNNDAVPLNPPTENRSNFLNDWRPKHTPEITQPIVDTIVKSILSKWAPKWIVATGYCYGAKYAVRLLGTGSINSAAIFHPSFITIDEIKAINVEKTTLYIGAAEVDPVFQATLRHETEDVLQKIGAKYRLTLNHGVSHGFAVRGDISDPWIKYAKERVFADAVDWFKISHQIYLSSKS